jgi:hypothetical protein
VQGRVLWREASRIDMCRKDDRFLSLLDLLVRMERQEGVPKGTCNGRSLVAATLAVQSR